MGTEFPFLALAAWFARDAGVPAGAEAEGGRAAAGEGPAVQSPASPAGASGSSFIGPGVRLVGSLRCREDFVVQGCVEGPVAAEGQVVVERGGLVEGDIAAAVIRVRGRTRGTLAATAEIILEKGCDHRGGLTSPELAVEAGALIEGGVRVGPRLAAGGEPRDDVPQREGHPKPLR